jgi:Mg-chelatase subunit ChlD
MADPTLQALIDGLKQQIANAPEGLDTSALEKAVAALKAADLSSTIEDERVKIWFLLDRSGSMGDVAEDVIGGFNQFVTEQAAKPGKARLTAVQFDGTDPFEVIFDAHRVTQVPALTSTTYRPRGMTPLYDAIGRLIGRADDRIADRKTRNRPVEDQLVIVFTDGLENASLEFDRVQVFDLIKDRTDQDWTFVFMGANQDSYGEGHKMGLVDGNVQDYDATGESVAYAFLSMSRASGEYRDKSRVRRHADKDQFFGGLKEAEEALRQKKNR